MISKFKYNEDPAYAYAPGFSNKGDDGLTGEQGTSGANMYFIDYDLDNSYAIELTLQKLDNNQILTTNTSSVLTRSYQINDLIFTSSNKIYKLYESNNELHKFSISLLGVIEDSRLESISISTECTKSAKDICIPTSRSTAMTDQVDSTEGTWKTTLYGINVKYTLSNLDSDYKYGLKLYIDNNKVYQSEWVPGSVSDISTNMSDPINKDYYDICNFNFKKIIELNDLTNDGKTFSFYDQCIDRVKIQGNNIKCVINNDKNKSYEGSDISTSGAAQNVLNNMFNDISIESSTPHKFIHTSYTEFNNDSGSNSELSPIYNKFAGNSMYVSKWNDDPENSAAKVIINILNNADTFLTVTNIKSGKTVYKKVKIEYTLSNE